MLIVPRLRRAWRDSGAVEGLVGEASASGHPAAAHANGVVSANGATAAHEVASANGATPADGARAVVIDDQVSNGDHAQAHGNGATPVVIDDQVTNGDHAPEQADASDLASIETGVESPEDDNVVEGPPYRKKGGRAAVLRGAVGEHHPPHSLSDGRDSRRRSDRRLQGGARPDGQPGSGPTPPRSGSGSGSGSGGRIRDAFPHTRRPLPWLLAAFLTMLFFVPVDSTK